MMDDSGPSSVARSLSQDYVQPEIQEAPIRSTAPQRSLTSKFQEQVTDGEDDVSNGIGGPGLWRLRRRRKKRRPWGFKWRSSAWFITGVVGFAVCCDALSYLIIIPVLPYRLEALGYTGVSALVSWLGIAYCAGIIMSGLPVAYFFARYPWRRGPLVVAVCVQEGAQILFLLAHPYAWMVVSRFIMGAASTVVWTVGFALICENVDTKSMGRQLGFAMSGLSIGSTIAPPIGGVLYWSLGWNAPFIFVIVACAVDLIARLFVIEGKDVLDYEDTAPSDPAQISHEQEKAIQGQGSKISPDPQPRLQSKVISTLSPWRVIVELFKSSRGMDGFLMTFVFGFVIALLDTTLTLRVQNIWHKDSAFVGLAYLAAAAPTFVTGPLVGSLADKFGAEWIIAPGLLFSAPWLALMILKSSLAGFIVYFALSQTLLGCSMAPVGLEVAMAAREVEGMSEIHQFAALNLSFAVSGVLGALVGGQMYDHLKNGWEACCWLIFAMSLASLPIPFFTAGSRTLWDRVKRKPAKQDTEEAGTQASASEETEQDRISAAQDALPPDTVTGLAKSTL